MSIANTRRALLLVGLLGGCGSVQLNVAFKPHGEYDPSREKGVKAQYLKQRDQGTPVNQDVSVLVDSIPAGIAIKDGVVSVEEGYQHAIVGRFGLGPDRRFFPDYRAGWRKYYCYPQQPLAALSLAAWMIVPIYYPCFTTYLRSKDEIIEEAKRAVSAAGGDLAVVSFIGEHDSDRATGVVGFILRVDPRMKTKKIETKPQKLEGEKLSI